MWLLPQHVSACVSFAVFVWGGGTCEAEHKLAAASELHRTDLWFDLISSLELREPSFVQTKH